MRQPVQKPGCRGLDQKVGRTISGGDSFRLFEGKASFCVIPAKAAVQNIETRARELLPGFLVAGSEQFNGSSRWRVGESPTGSPAKTGSESEQVRVSVYEGGTVAIMARTSFRERAPRALEGFLYSGLIRPVVAGRSSRAVGPANRPPPGPSGQDPAGSNANRCAGA